MSDEHLRDAERSNQADPSNRARLLAMRLRAGHDLDERTKLAAFLRDEPSALVLGGMGSSGLIRELIARLGAAHPELPEIVAYLAAHFVHPLIGEAYRERTAGAWNQYAPPTISTSEQALSSIQRWLDTAEEEERAAQRQLLVHEGEECRALGTTLHELAIEARHTSRSLGQSSLGADRPLAAAHAVESLACAIDAVLVQEPTGVSVAVYGALENAYRALIARAVGHAHQVMRSGHDRGAATRMAELAEEHLFVAIQTVVLPWALHGEVLDLTLPPVDSAALWTQPRGPAGTRHYCLYDPP